MSKLLALLTLFLVGSSASALPKFASRMNLSCKSCHVNPTGGGLRNAFGTSYGQEDLPIPTWQEDYSLEEFSTQLSEVVSVGANFRMLYFYQQTSPTTSRNSFFQMQSDLYFSARIAKKTSIYLNRGNGSRVEAFGLAGILPMDGYIKAGWFIPNFGIRMDDHNIFTRDKTLFAFGGGHDAGVEVGFSPGMFDFTLGVMNGAAGDRDDNSLKSLLARGEARIAVSGVNLRGGGSYYNNATPAGVRTYLGVHGIASLGGNLTVLGEFIQRRDFSNATKIKTYSNILYVEANYLLMQGVDAKVGYEFFDHDTKYTTGTESRIVIGLELYPISGVELRPLYVIRKEQPTDVSNDQFIVMLHLYL
ncbi:MAG: hypothetical protein WEF53_03580 [Bacteroidota bacterium]